MYSHNSLRSVWHEAIPFRTKKEIMTNETFLLIGKLCWFISGGSVLYIIFNITRAVKKDNRSLKNHSLQVWREVVVPSFKAHRHLTPLESLDLTKECVNNGLFSEAELGIMLDELLGHAVLCQQDVLATRKKELQTAEFHLESLRGDTEMSADAWQNAVSASIRNIQGMKNQVESARADLANLTNRWKKATGENPQLQLRFA